MGFFTTEEFSFVASVSESLSGKGVYSYVRRGLVCGTWDLDFSLRFCG